MWTILGLIGAAYFLAIGVALLLWPRRLLDLAARSRTISCDESVPKAKSVIAMRAVGVIALGLCVLILLVVAA